VCYEPIHDHMPAILGPQDYDEWLDRGEVERAPIHLLRPFPETTRQIHAANPGLPLPTKLETEGPCKKIWLVSIKKN